MCKLAALRPWDATWQGEFGQHQAFLTCSSAVARLSVWTSARSADACCDAAFSMRSSTLVVLAAVAW